MGPGLDLFPGEGKKGFRLRKGHNKEERVGGKVEIDSKKVSHSVLMQKIFKFSHNLNVSKEPNALRFACFFNPVIYCQ